MPTSTLTSKGQVTIPKPIREYLGLDIGDRVVFRTLEDGRVIVEGENIDLRNLRGILKPARRGVSLADLDRAIREGGTRR